jgi:hypothetical protein
MGKKRRVALRIFSFSYHWSAAMPTAKSKSSPKKPKRVRVSFTLPKSEHATIDALKTQAVALGTAVKKSGLLRAGLVALQGMSDAAFKRALAAVPAGKGSPPVTAAEGKPPVASKRPARKAAVKTPAKAAPASVARKRTAAKKTPAQA